MTHQNDYTLTSELAEKGLDAAPELLHILIYNAMQAERSKYLQVEEYECNEYWKGHANGYKPMSVRTRIGEINMKQEVIIVNTSRHTTQIRELFWEYLQWANAKVNEEFGVNFDIEHMIEADMQHLDIFMPPTGRLLLGYQDDFLAGIACLKYLEPGIGEVKRMYVRIQNRQKGLGRALVSRLVSEAVKIGYGRIRLDSAGFMKEAHQLYRSVGFNEIAAYEGSEIPREFQKHWVFMEMEVGKRVQGS